MAVEVYEGNTADPSTLKDQIHKVRERFGLDRVVPGDVDQCAHSMRSCAVEGLRLAVRCAAMPSPSSPQSTAPCNCPCSTDLAEIRHPDFPGNRLPQPLAAPGACASCCAPPGTGQDRPGDPTPKTGAARPERHRTTRGASWGLQDGQALQHQHHPNHLPIPTQNPRHRSRGAPGRHPDFRPELSLDGGDLYQRVTKLETGSAGTTGGTSGNLAHLPRPGLR